MDMDQLIAKYDTFGISKVLSRLAKEDEEGLTADSDALEMAVNLRSALESYVERYGKE